MCLYIDVCRCVFIYLYAGLASYLLYHCCIYVPACFIMSCARKVNLTTAKKYNSEIKSSISATVLEALRNLELLT